MKLLVVYYSKTGFAKRYAQWLEKDLSCDCVPFAQRRGVDLSRYDGVVFGSSLRAGKIRKLSWFRKQLPQLSGKRLAVYFTGAMGPDPKAVRQAVAQNLTPREQEQVKAFYLWGGLNYEAMGGVDKWMMGVFRKMLQGKRTPRKRTVRQPGWWPPPLTGRTRPIWPPWRNISPGERKKRAACAGRPLGCVKLSNNAPRQ